jgi:hypothetical protein
LPQKPAFSQFSSKKWQFLVRKPVQRVHFKDAMTTKQQNKLAMYLVMERKRRRPAWALILMVI